jgi:hypothetical protein
MGGVFGRHSSVTDQRYTSVYIKKAPSPLQSHGEWIRIDSGRALSELSIMIRERRSKVELPTCRMTIVTVHSSGVASAGRGRT